MTTPARPEDLNETQRIEAGKLRAPHRIERDPGHCAGCGERIRLSSRWAHRRCALVLYRHRAPFKLTDWLSLTIEGYGRLDEPPIEVTCQCGAVSHHPQSCAAVSKLIFLEDS